MLMLGLLFFPCLVAAQGKPMKWGEVPRADLEMKNFPEDSNATAVILCDYGTVSFDEEFRVVFNRHRRIKILSQAGYTWGDYAVQYYDKSGVQRVEGIEGQTFVLETDGSVRREKLDKKSIFDEDVDGDWRRKRFTLPSLNPGAVVEYRYRLVSKYATSLPNWDFQTSEPTRWSEFCVEIPSVLDYAMVLQELPSFDVHESKLLNWPPSTYAYETASRYNLKIMYHRWVKRDMPALREEPFMTTPDDYRAKVRFQLSRIEWPGMPPEKVMDSWEKLAEELMDFEDFGKQIERHKVLREQAEVLVSGVTDPEEKLRRIYDYVRTTMAWDGKRGIYTDVNLDKAFQARRGGGPEIALMLTGMLRFAGLEAQPVLISTRDHGRVFDVYSILTQFNHVLTYVKAGSNEYLLDATDPLRPYNILPVAALNQLGWMVEKKNPSWINITNPGSFHNHTIVHAVLSEGSLTGRFESMDAGYSGLFDRQTLREGKKEEDYIRDGWLSDLTGARLDSFKISQRDSSEVPLETKAYFSSSDHAQVAGDNIYFNPIFFGRREENPLKRPQRTFPVDFAYASKIIYTMNLKLPAGYTIQELPKNIVVDLPNQGGQFRRLMQVEGNILQVTSQIIVRKVRFDPQEYKFLREFYDRIVAAHAEQVVLKREPMAITKEGGIK